MSLVQRVLSLQAVSLVLSLVGAVLVSVGTMRLCLQAEIGQKNRDVAQSLALVLSQQGGDRVAMALTLSSQFDIGTYSSLRLVGYDGVSLFERAEAPVADVVAPAWFVDALALAPPAGTALVSSGWRPLGQVEVSSRLGRAQAQLWRGTVALAALLALVGVLAGGVALAGLRSVRQALRHAVWQAGELAERRFVRVEPSRVRELRELTLAMNGLVERLQQVAAAQAEEVEALRRRSFVDEPTGLYRRSHFMDRLRQLLIEDEAATAGWLLLLRVPRLPHCQAELGHVRAEALLAEVGRALAAVQPALVGGRLNVSDFALLSSDLLHFASLVEALRTRLQVVCADAGGAGPVLGIVGWRRHQSPAALLAAADQALAKAELGPPLTVVWEPDTGPAPMGEDRWRRAFDGALDGERLTLVEYPLVDAAGALVHLECPLRLRVDAGQDWLTAAQWLPMAHRLGRTLKLDLAAIRLALARSACDALPRAVNLAAPTVMAPGFVDQLRELLAAQAQAATCLWLELPADRLAELAPHLHVLRPVLRRSGTRLGIEHLGSALVAVATVMPLGLDYAKLGAGVVDGLADDADRQAFVSGALRMFKGLGVRVFAEGVSSPADAQALARLGLDGWTGPLVRGR